MLPLLATAVVAATGNIYAGLGYPIGVVVMTLIVGSLVLRDTRGVNIATGSGCHSENLITRRVQFGLVPAAPRLLGLFCRSLRLRGSSRWAVAG
jgi:hypothetical protein